MHEVAILYSSHKVGIELERDLRANHIPNVSIDLYPRCKITRLIEDIAKLLNSNFMHESVMYSEVINNFIHLVFITELPSKEEFKIRQRLYLFIKRSQEYKISKWL